MSFSHQPLMTSVYEWHCSHACTLVMGRMLDLPILLSNQGPSKGQSHYSDLYCKKTKNIETTNSTKNGEWLLQVLRKGRQVLPYQQHLSCYSSYKPGDKSWINLKKIAPSGGRREHFWGISCEKSQFYAKKLYFFPIAEGGAKIFGVFR
jgi:hypothetical protein